MEKKVAVKEFKPIIDGDHIGYEATVILQYLDTFGVSEDDYTKDLGWKNTLGNVNLINFNYRGGVMPNIEISNKNLLQAVLGTNETFTAGDFPVTIIDAQGSNGIYSGTGYVQVPYLADTKIKVVFNNIQLNTDRQLISGVVETSYDVNEENVIDIKSIKDLLNDFNAIITKENPTREDIKRLEDIKKQWEFYLSNINDLDMTEEDKQSFKNIQDVLFKASTLPLSEKDRENAKKASEEAQKLYEKYEKEFDKLKDNSPHRNIKNIDFEKLKSAENILFFVNGHYSSILPGPSKGNAEYWFYFDNSKKKHFQMFSEYFNFNFKETIAIYIDGSSKLGIDQDFNDRFKKGKKMIKFAIEKDNSLTKKRIAIVAHSEGVAYAAGMIEELYKNSSNIKEAIYLSADEGAEPKSYTNPNIPTYQIEYAYFDTDKDKGCIAHYDWVIGTNLRYKTYSGIKGVTKFGIAINNNLDYQTVHGSSASPNIIDYIKVLKGTSYTQNLNSEGKMFYQQVPKSNIKFWKINHQFIDANHPKFDLKTGKINHNIKCRK